MNVPHLLRSDRFGHGSPFLTVWYDRQWHIGSSVDAYPWPLGPFITYYVHISATGLTFMLYTYSRSCDHRVSYRYRLGYVSGLISTSVDVHRWNTSCDAGPSYRSLCSSPIEPSEPHWSTICPALGHDTLSHSQAVRFAAPFSGTNRRQLYLPVSSDMYALQRLRKMHIDEPLIRFLCNHCSLLIQAVTRITVVFRWTVSFPCCP